VFTIMLRLYTADRRLSTISNQSFLQQGVESFF
jgi:hypothetical protein